MSKYTHEPTLLEGQLYRAWYLYVDILTKIL